MIGIKGELEDLSGALTEAGYVFHGTTACRLEEIRRWGFFAGDACVFGADGSYVDVQGIHFGDAATAWSYALDTWEHRPRANPNSAPVLIAFKLEDLQRAGCLYADANSYLYPLTNVKDAAIREFDATGKDHFASLRHLRALVLEGELDKKFIEEAALTFSAPDITEKLTEIAAREAPPPAEVEVTPGFLR